MEAYKYTLAITNDNRLFVVLRPEKLDDEDEWFVSVVAVHEKTPAIAVFKTNIKAVLRPKL